jgi:O-antigen/teichoic acid export membrane protein
MLSLRYATRQMAEVVALWKGYCLGWLAVTGAFAGFVNIFARPLMHALYAGRFDDLASLVGTLALLPVVMGIGNAMNAALKSIEKPQAVFYAYVTSGVATFLIGVPLVMHLGLRGAVYGMLVSGGAYTVALGIAFLSAIHAEGYAAPLEATVKESPLP